MAAQAQGAYADPRTTLVHRVAGDGLLHIYPAAEFRDSRRLVARPIGHPGTHAKTDLRAQADGVLGGCPSCLSALSHPPVVGVPHMPGAAGMVRAAGAPRPVVRTP
jgi:hypothetical protein